MNEKELHASLEQWYAGQEMDLGFRFDGFLIDIFRERSLDRKSDPQFFGHQVEASDSDAFPSSTVDEY